MTYRNFKDLTRRTAFDKILCDKEFNFAKNPKYDGCQKGLASMVYKCFDKKCVLLVWSETSTTRNKSSSSSGITNENMSKKS